MPNTSRTATRTAAWPLDSIVRSSAPHVDPIDRTATTAVPTASSTKTMRMTALCRLLCDDSTIVIRRIGPNSPTAPAARRYVPNRVRSSPASRRIGNSVPIAVVASAEPV